MKQKGFPENPGLYIAQREYDVVLIKITGMYPTLQVGKCVYLSAMIGGNTIKEAPKEIVDNIILFSKNWEFSKIESIDTRVFPKTAFKVDGNLDLGTDEKLSLRNTYYRLVQSGVSSSKIIRALMYEYHVTMDEVVRLINEFDLCQLLVRSQII